MRLMISKKELEYVGKWASKTPHPGKNYAKETLEKLAYTKQVYDENYKGRKYNICFSNKNEIELEIMNKNLAHMFGIDYRDLSSEFHSRFREEILGLQVGETISSYDLLTKIIENYQSVMEYEEQIERCILNYYQINIKCGIFEKITDLSNFNYGCIELNRNKYMEVNGKELKANSEKMLFTPSGEVNAPYFMMGIIQNKPLYNNSYDGDETQEQESLIPTYAVETLLAPNNAGAFFNQQEVAIPTHLLYADQGHFIKKEASASEKLELLRMYKKITLEYSLTDSLNISGDYELMLNDLSKNENKTLTLR